MTRISQTIKKRNRPRHFWSNRTVSLHGVAFLIFGMMVMSTAMCGFSINPAVETPQTAEPSPPPPSASSSAQLPDTAGTTPRTDSSQQSSSTEVLLPFIFNRAGTVSAGQDWPTVAASPERTSWSAEEVSGELHVEWYRPIEAYISQNTQVIAAHGMLYISTARGLYALDAATGDTVWRFDTELPLGNSPTVAGGVAYVGGYDRKIHALDALSGQHLWAFEGAQAGFSTNPLVVEGKVIIGSRDGAMYAIGAHSSPNRGQLVWKYQTGGPILLSAAYKDGVVYFAANDNHAYAIRVSSGEPVWKSEKLPGDGYQSYWPVIYQDKVIFSAANAYRHNLPLGTQTIKDSQGTGYETFDRLQKDDLYFDKPDGGNIGTVSETAEPWSNGKAILNASRISEYLEDNPDSHPHLHKPWRRTLIVLNMADGREYTFDSDNDGHPEYTPVAWWGTRSGNRYPPLVGLDGTLYVNNLYWVGAGQWDIPQGQVMGWKMGTPFFSLVGAQGAVDEPQALSGGGSALYRNICCDRVGDYSWVDTSGFSTLWHYSTPLSQLAPGYDEMWWGIDPNSDFPRLEGNYGNQNGIYHNHGDQNPIIPYQGKLYVHRSNAIIAYGSGQQLGKLTTLKIDSAQDTVPTPSGDELRARLEAEIQKIVSVGSLRPGYYNSGVFSQLDHLNNYFDNPGETLYTVARAYPYLSPALQEQTRAYLKKEFQNYFASTMYAKTGWADGAAREAMPLPPEVEDAMSGDHASETAHFRWSWQYPPFNFYALWKYAEVFPEDAGLAYERAKEKLQVPVPDKASNSYLQNWPFEHNAYIAGYIGFLELQELAGKTGEDSDLRGTVTNELNRLLLLRASSFSKDTPWIKSATLPSVGDDYNNRSLNISRNFMYLVPELGAYLREHALSRVQEAVAEYNRVAPYWFVSRYNAVPTEGASQHLYDYVAVFQAKAYVLQEPRSSLYKYLDAPAFVRGDLYYIQNIIATIEAGGD